MCVRQHYSFVEQKWIREGARPGDEASPVMLERVNPMYDPLQVAEHRSRREHGQRASLTAENMLFVQSTGLPLREVLLCASCLVICFDPMSWQFSPTFGELASECPFIFRTIATG